MNFIFLAALLLSTPLALAQQSAAPRPGVPASQNLAALRTVVEHYLQGQSAGLAGTASVEVRALDPRTSLPACADPQAFQQPGARAWGNTTVGVRCSAPTAWTVYVQAKVTVQGEYVAAAVPLAQGQLVRVVSNGAGVPVSAAARAIGNASEGQVVQVRTSAGAILSGIAKAGGLVEVVF